MTVAARRAGFKGWRGELMKVKVASVWRSINPPRISMRAAVAENRRW